jgi:tRNA dimethylallyltransferase
MAKPIILQLFGPTASGKTSLAIGLAQKLNGVIINADSRQIYCGLPLLSAMPTRQERASAPHELYDFLDPTEPFSVGDYLKAARSTAARVIEEGKTPIFVGGTGFYLNALKDGLSPLPVVPREYSVDLFERAKKEGVETLYKELQEVDPTAAEKISANDTQRICRALGVFAVSGAPFSFWQKEKPQGGLPYKFIKIGLMPERDKVLERQEMRFDMIMDQGVLDEVETFAKKWPDIDRNALTVHGYREFSAYLRHESSLEEARDKIIIHMRQYAKRQMTWMRNSYKPDVSLTSHEDLDGLLEKLKAFKVKNLSV